MVRFYIPLRSWLELFMLYREYISTGENLHFLSEVCKQEVCLTIKRRMAKEMQVVGGPSSTDDGRNKINTGGKSRERAVPHSFGLRNYIKEETLAIHRDRGTNGNEIGENITIIKRKSRHGISHLWDI